MFRNWSKLGLVATAFLLVAVNGCEGPAGTNGDDGTDGTDGTNGMNGANGMDGTNGMDGQQGPPGMPPAPLATNIADYVKARVTQVATGMLPGDVQFPLKSAATDTLRTLDGAQAQVIVRWLEPLVFASGVNVKRFGANTDFIAYFGDGWNADPKNPPQWNGSSEAAWLWVNHEYISGTPPSTTVAPKGQYLTYAQFLQKNGILTNQVEMNTWTQADIDTYMTWLKTQLGGSWLRIVRDPSTSGWTLDRSGKSFRYDSTSATQARITGATLLSGLDHDDSGAPLPAGVVVGTSSNCSGGVSPWGTVFTGEENTQVIYGDAEECWSSEQKFLTGAGYDPGSDVSPVMTASPLSDFGKISDPNGQHARDTHGYLLEIDPGVDPAEYEGKTQAGVGHKKIGSFGRARWENTTFAVDSSWKLVPNMPIVMYAGDDRRSGRIYKWVSTNVYTDGMTRTQIRALLDSGRTYVAHFGDLDNATGNTLAATGKAPTDAAPGKGTWIYLSVASTDIAPNGAALNQPNITVGTALKNNTYNNIGGFPTDDHVLRSLFTATNKLGIKELNRPEDLEYNPKDPSGMPRIYVALTNHTRRVALDATGKLYDPATHATTSPLRTDAVGQIFAISEEMPMNPGASKTFQYVEVWHGSKGTGDYDAANPDNILFDRDGGVWFGTDGNFTVNGQADAVYYLDLDAQHKAGETGITVPTYGKPFRVAAVPSDAEATGPAFSTDMRTLFVSVQHPGEETYSSWPDGGTPLPSLVAINFLLK